MKRIGGQLFNELKKRSAHIVYGFLVTKNDGSQLGFTSGDTSFDYNGVTYSATNGLLGTAAASKQNLSVDNMTATSLITATIPERDLRAGRFDNAKVKVFWICPEHPEYGIVPIRGGRFGDITTKNAEFEVELRALAFYMQQPFGKFFVLECAAKLGDGDCKVNLDPDVWSPASVHIAKAGADAGIGSWVMPTVDNGFWYWCVGAKSNASTSGPNPFWTDPFSSTIAFQGSVVKSQNGWAGGAVGGGGYKTTVEQANVDITGQVVDSSLYLTPTKQYKAPTSAPFGTQPITITTHSVKVVLALGTAGTVEPVWPLLAGQTVADGELLWKAYPARKRRGTVTAIFNRGEFEDKNMNSAAHFFQYGLVTWLTGRNAGFSMEVRDFLFDPRPAFYLLEQMPFKIQVGDTYEVTVGCAKTRPVCINKFENMNNFRGQPDMPTEDRALQTPSFSQQGTQADPNAAGGS